MVVLVLTYVPMAQAKTSSKRSKRIDFGSSALSIEYPDFLDIQPKAPAH